MTAEFAIADETLNKFIDLYVKTRSQVMLLMPLIILLRVGWNFIKGSGPISFIEIIKDVFVCTALLFFFHQYIRACYRHGCGRTDLFMDQKRTRL